MSTTTNQDRQDPGYQDNHAETNMVYNNDWLQESKSLYPDDTLSYNDPAVINPDELATFPKEVRGDSHHHHHHESHLVNKRTPVRDGRNITRTDNHPDKHGFM